MTDDRKKKRVLFLISAALVATIIIAYEPIRHNGFVNYDDDKYITSNPSVNEGISRDSVTYAFTQSHFYMWHPLTTLSNILDCQIFGLNPLPHHFINVLLHIANVLLLLWILFKMTDSIWASTFVAAVFALHPLQVESVAWAAERKTVLSGLFWFLTIAIYIWYTKRPVIRQYGLLLAIYGLCIMTKPSVVTLPFVLLLLDYWPLGRFNIKGGENPALHIKRLLMEKAPLLLMSGLLCVMTVIAQKSGGAIAGLEKVSFDSRLANMFVSYMRYIGKTIWPSKLAVFYPHTLMHYADTKVIICALLFLLITALSIYAGRRRRYIAVGWLWFAGTLVPMIGLVQAGAQAMANRYMYISILGLLIIIAWFAKELITRYPGLRYIAAVFAVVILSIAIVFTRTQVKRWENNFTLFEYAMKVTENNALVENNYGVALLEKGRVKDAEAHLSKAIQIYPAYFDAYSNLGAVYSQLGQDDLAIKNFNKAMELKPDNTETLNNFAWTLATNKEVSAENSNRAVKLSQRACELTQYKDPALLDTLSACYAAAGKFKEAIKTANEALKFAIKKKDEKLAGEIRDRIKLYQSGRRFIEK